MNSRYQVATNPNTLLDSRSGPAVLTTSICNFYWTRLVHSFIQCARRSIECSARVAVTATPYTATPAFESILFLLHLHSFASYPIPSHDHLSCTYTSSSRPLLPLPLHLNWILSVKFNLKQPFNTFSLFILHFLQFSVES